MGWHRRVELRRMRRGDCGPQERVLCSQVCVCGLERVDAPPQLSDFAVQQLNLTDALARGIQGMFTPASA